MSIFQSRASKLHQLGQEVESIKFLLVNPKADKHAISQTVSVAKKVAKEIVRLARKEINKPETHGHASLMSPTMSQELKQVLEQARRLFLQAEHEDNPAQLARLLDEGNKLLTLAISKHWYWRKETTVIKYTPLR